jgi:hypothetical protein
MRINRITIYQEDIQRITGKSGRCARTLMTRIRKHYNKPSHQFISIDEFCQYSGLKADDVKSLL